MENKVGDLSLAVKDLCCQFDLITRGAEAGMLGAPPGLATTISLSFPAGLPLKDKHSGPIGQYIDPNHWGIGLENLSSLTPTRS
jgi:hypothetical protein